MIQAEAREFLQAHQVMLNSVVKNVKYSKSGVQVVLDNNEVISGEYALCTFSLGVLQHDDVEFTPELPSEHC